MLRLDKLVLLIFVNNDGIFKSFAGRRCYVSGWGKDVFGPNGTYQNTLKVIYRKLIKANMKALSTINSLILVQDVDVPVF